MRLRPRILARGLAAAAVGAGLVLVPNSSAQTALATLVEVDSGGSAYVEHDKGVIWILALGSDARIYNGEDPLRTRADSIQLVAVDPDRGTASIIGIPRDSWVPIPGAGSNRINAGLYFGGPQLMAKVVGDLIGVKPDYVFLTTFGGLRGMVDDLGGVTVQSDMAFTDDNMEGEIEVGPNRLNGEQALFFARARHFLPRGDFDRSAHQQELMKAIVREVQAHASDAGVFDKALWTAALNLHTDLSPVALYKLGRALISVDAEKVTSCVLPGSIGNINGASVVIPDVAAARRLGKDAADDATLDTSC